VLEIQSQIDLFYSDHTTIQMNEFAIKEQLPSCILIMIFLSHLLAKSRPREHAFIDVSTTKSVCSMKSILCAKLKSLSIVTILLLKVSQSLSKFIKVDDEDVCSMMVLVFV
jgi:hypothetical protein